MKTTTKFTLHPIVPCSILGVLFRLWGVGIFDVMKTETHIDGNTYPGLLAYASRLEKSQVVLLRALTEATDYMAKVNPKREQSPTVQRLRLVISKAGL